MHNKKRKLLVELVKEMTGCFSLNIKNSAEINLSLKGTLDNKLRNSFVPGGIWSGINEAWGVLVPLTELSATAPSWTSGDTLRKRTQWTKISDKAPSPETLGKAVPFCGS